MGTNTSAMINKLRHPDIYPDYKSEATFDPQFGFQEPRKPKVMIATPEEMESANIELEFRDYCAHLFIDFQACKAKNLPFVGRCAHEFHAWNHCLYEERVDCYKDYEREKRLRERAQRIEKKKRKEELRAARESLEE